MLSSGIFESRSLTAERIWIRKVPTYSTSFYQVNVSA
jgi:hypothetical protein